MVQIFRNAQIDFRLTILHSKRAKEPSGSARSVARSRTCGASETHVGNGDRLSQLESILLEGGDQSKGVLLEVPLRIPSLVGSERIGLHPIELQALIMSHSLCHPSARVVLVCSRARTAVQRPRGLGDELNEPDDLRRALGRYSRSHTDATSYADLPL